MTANGLFYKREGDILSSFWGLLPFDWIWKCIVIITERAVLPFLLAGEEIYFVLFYVTGDWAEAGSCEPRTWLTFDCCELFRADQIKYPSFGHSGPSNQYSRWIFTGLLVLVLAPVYTFLLLWLMFCLNRLRPWQVPHEMINPLW